MIQTLEGVLAETNDCRTKVDAVRMLERLRRAEAEEQTAPSPAQDDPADPGFDPLADLD